MVNSVTRKVMLKGIRPMMFDRYGGSNNEQLSPMDKVYVGSDGKALILPSLNLISFLSSQNTESAPQRLLGKKWRSVAKAALSFVNIEPDEIPILRNGKPLTKDNAKLVIDHRVARVKKGGLAIPNPKERPVLATPWEVGFTVTLFQNPDLTESVLKRLFEDGGMCIGLGTYRGLFGKFIVESWEERN